MTVVPVIGIIKHRSYSRGKLVSNYSTWSLEKLKKESLKIEKAIKEKEAREKKIAVAEIKALAKKHGFALSDLLTESEQKTKFPSKPNGLSRKSASAYGKAKKTACRAKAKIKYRNPHNDQETWTGRGRQPRWVAFHITNGGTLDDLSV